MHNQEARGAAEMTFTELPQSPIFPTVIGSSGWITLNSLTVFMFVEDSYDWKFCFIIMMKFS